MRLKRSWELGPHKLSRFVPSKNLVCLHQIYQPVPVTYGHSMVYGCKFDPSVVSKQVKNAIPMIMGANIGTSVTNTIVSMFQIGNKDEYRRAFAGATVHDCFNFLSVVVLLPVEAATGLLREIAAGIVGDEDYDQEDSIDFLKKITKPVTSRIVAVDKKLVTKVAEAEDQATLDELLE
eukprot:928073-Amphidinium_carterae.1